MHSSRHRFLSLVACLALVACQAPVAPSTSNAPGSLPSQVQVGHPGDQQLPSSLARAMSEAAAKRFLTEEDAALGLVQAYYPTSSGDGATAPVNPEAALEVELPSTEGQPLTLTTRGHRFQVKALDANPSTPKRTVEGSAFYGSQHLWTSLGGKTETSTGGWVTQHAEEYVVLTSGEKEHRARYEVSVPEGIVAVRDAGEYLEFLDTHELPVLRMHYGVARDAQGLSRQGETRLRGVVPTHKEPARFALVDRTLSVELVIGLEGLTGPIVVDPGWSSTGSMAATRWDFVATLLPTGKVLVSGGMVNGGYSAATELYDPATGTWSSSGSMGSVRSNHTMTVLPTGKVLAAGGYGGSSSIATAMLYDPATGTWAATGSMAATRRAHTATLLLDGRVLVTGGVNSTYIASAEIYDPTTGTWSSTANMPESHGSHTATLLPNGKVLVTGGVSSNVATNKAALYDPATGAWTSTGSLATARYWHTTTLLPNGKVLASGGYNSSATSLASAELYDPATGAWSATGSMSTPRVFGATALLHTGQVLIAGGFGATNSPIASNEIYDPYYGSWYSYSTLSTSRSSPAGALLPDSRFLVAGGQSSGGSSQTAELCDPMVYSRATSDLAPTPRTGATATLLPTGKVLLVGGRTSTGGYAAPELFDPSNSSKGSTTGTQTTRTAHTATLLLDGRVLVTGGITGTGNTPTPSVDRYDPSTNTWSTTGPLATARSRHTATLLLDGRVLVTGGVDGTGATLGSSELYDPATGTWSATGTLAVPREGHVALRLSNGKVLVAAGNGGTSPTASAELYDPATGTWSLTGSLATARVGHAATPLSNGQVLVVAGRNAAGTFLTSAERYDPVSGTWLSAGSILFSARDTPTAMLMFSGKVLVSAGRTDSAGTSTYAQDVYDPKTNTWRTTTSLSMGRSGHAAVLLPSGTVLLLGGANGSTFLNTTERYDDVGGASDTWRPVVTQPTSITQGRALTVTGSRFRGISEASGGNIYSSPTDFPSQVMLMPVEGGAITRFSPTRFTSTTLDTVAPGVRPGYYLLSVTVNAITGGRVVRIERGSVTAPDVPATTAEDTAGAVTLSATSSLGQPLTYSVFSTPSHGTLSGTAPNLTYTPEANYYGNDSFQYQASDGTNAAIGTVSLTVTPVNDAPVANDLYAVATTGTPTVLSLPASDLDGDVLTVTVVTAPSHGTLSGTGTNLTYTSESGYTGPDAFTYQVSDGSLVSGEFTVSLTVNSAPVLATAVYDSTLKVPRCSSAASSCDSGTLLNGRGPLGPEPNQPNTLGGTCADGTTGSYHGSPSLDRLTVSTLDGSLLAAGKTVKIEASVWAWAAGVDALDLYSTTNITSPNWVYIGTVGPAGSGARVISATYTLPSTVGTQAIRGLYRYGGSATGACLPSYYTDHDDLVFTVSARDAALPTTSLTSPTAGAVVHGTVTLTASASDNVGVAKVEYYDGSTLLGTRTVPPFAYAWNTASVANGSHTLTSKAYDTTGNVGTSAGVSITVDNQVPSVSLTAPAGGTTLSGTVTLTATASDNLRVTKVEFYDGTTLLGSSTTSPYSWSWDTRAASNGSHALSARAYDTAGNVGVSSSVTVTTHNDVEPPVLAFTSPEDGATVSGTLNVTVDVTDNVGVARVDYEFDGYPQASLTTPPYSWSYSVLNAGNTLHVVTATAYDTAGNAAEPVSLVIAVDNPTRPRW